MNWAVNQTFTYANNSQFYALVNPTYYDYYNRIVRLNLEWFDGYVLGFHNQQNGIMSTRIATALVNGIIGNVFQKIRQVTTKPLINSMSGWKKTTF